MIKRTVKLVTIIFIIIIIYFLLGEIIVRYETFGNYGFSKNKLESIAWLNTPALIHGVNSSEMKDICKIPYYTPNKTVLYRGEIFSTNSFGIRGKEISLEKPKDTFRILVIGNSYTEGAGILQEEHYTGVFEQLLNKRNNSRKIEVLNFGRTMHLWCGWNKTKYLMAFSPDMIILQGPQVTAVTGVKVEEVLNPVADFENNTNIPILILGLYKLPIINTSFSEFANWQDFTEKNKGIFLAELKINHYIYKNQAIMPSETHSNRKVHSIYGKLLYDYFIKNEEIFYNASKPIKINITLPEIKIIPATNNEIRNPFWKSYFFDKITNQTNTIKGTIIGNL